MSRHHGQVIQAASYEGPLPPPSLLTQYNQAVPDAAERILAMAEKQAAHRQDLESRALTGEQRRTTWGLVSAVFVTILSLGAATYAIVTGHDAAGASLFGGSLVSIVIAFVRGTKSRRDEREARMKVLKGGS